MNDTYILHNALSQEDTNHTLLQTTETDTLLISQLNYLLLGDHQFLWILVVSPKYLANFRSEFFEQLDISAQLQLLLKHGNKHHKLAASLLL